MKLRVSLIASSTAFIILFMLSLCFCDSTKAANLDNHSPTMQSLSKMPLAFTENQGQWDESVQFRANAGGATMWFGHDGAYYQFTRSIEQSGATTSESALDEMHRQDKEPERTETMMIKAHFMGSKHMPNIVGIDELEYKCNYFIGNDPNEWHTDVPNYSAVLYEEVYDGIDLKYYGNGTQMEYDFIVEPGADFAQIKIEYQGAESVAINDNGELVVTTKWGEVIERRPFVYQIDIDAYMLVEGRYKLLGDNSFGFELIDYNPALAMVIDPVLSYSTYLGGSDHELGGAQETMGIAADNTGAAYIAGSTVSTDFPVFNAIQDTTNGSYDAFVTKMNSDGDGLIYSTYIGGFKADYAYDIAIDTSGAVYLTGSTASFDFPTQNAFQDSLHPSLFGAADAFVTKISKFGNSIVYSTYLGGTEGDRANGIAVDSTGAACIVGNTPSSDFPVFNAYQPTLQGTNDAFVAKLNSTGDGLIYSTFLGGSGGAGSFDKGTAIAVDASGAAYVTGYTQSTDFPTLNAYEDTRQGFHDAFVSKFSSGGGLVYSTYLGGIAGDQGHGIAVDAIGAVYVTGQTNSSDFPTVNALQATLPGVFGPNSAFVTKLSNTGATLIFSTYLGGNGHDYGYGIAVENSGAVWVTGLATYSDFPTQNPYQDSVIGLGDVFVVNLTSSGDSMLYGTFLGGTDYGGDNFADIGRDIAVDASGAVYVTGETWSVNFPMVNPYQGTLGGGWSKTDAFVAKFLPGEPTCCVDRGNVDNIIGPGGPVDVSDLTYLVAFLFKGGDPPPCEEEGNVDAIVGPGGPIDVSDLTYLVGFLFKGEAAPPACP